MYEIYEEANGFTIESVSGNQMRVSKIITAKHKEGNVTYAVNIIKLTANISKDGMFIFANVFIEKYRDWFLSNNQLFSFDYNSKGLEEGLKAFDNIINNLEFETKIDTYKVRLNERVVTWTRTVGGDIHVSVGIGDNISVEKTYRMQTIIGLSNNHIITVTDKDNRYSIEEIKLS